jgi:predicted exporter
LPQDDPDVLRLKDLADKIGGAANLIVAVEGPDAEANRRFAEAVAKNLQPLIGTDLRAIDYRADAGRAFFEHNKALYLDLVDLERIDDDLRKLIAGKKNPAFLAFADGVKGEVDDDPAEDLTRLKARLEKSEREDSFPSGYYESKDKTLLALIAWTSSSGTGDASGYRIRDDVQRIIASTNPSSFGPVRAQLTGDIISAIDEHDALRSDIAWVSMLCVALVLTVVGVYFRSIVSLGYIFFPTLLGVSMALAMTELAIGYLNTNTAFLGSIIIGKPAERHARAIAETGSAVVLCSARCWPR